MTFLTNLVIQSLSNDKTAAVLLWMAAADEAIRSGNLLKLTYFRDSISSKGLCDNKIIVTSVLRTDADVERLMRNYATSNMREVKAVFISLYVSSTLRGVK